MIDTTSANPATHPKSGGKQKNAQQSKLDAQRDAEKLAQKKMFFSPSFSIQIKEESFRYERHASQHGNKDDVRDSAFSQECPDEISECILNATLVDPGEGHPALRQWHHALQSFLPAVQEVSSH